jgi:hypothetical protein
MANLHSRPILGRYSHSKQNVHSRELSELINPIPSFAAACLILVSATSTASAQRQPVTEACRRIADPGARLACLDKAAASARFTQIMLPELFCRGVAHPYEVIMTLRREGMIAPDIASSADSIAYYKLKQPLDLDGLEVVGIFGFESNHDDVFPRAPGTGPGDFIGVVTTATSGSLDWWRRHRNLSLILNINDADDYTTQVLGVRRAYELKCR